MKPRTKKLKLGRVLDAGGQEKSPKKKHLTCVASHTVDGKNLANQLRLVVYPIIYRVFYIPGGWLWDFLSSAGITRNPTLFPLFLMARLPSRTESCSTKPIWSMSLPWKRSRWRFAASTRRQRFGSVGLGTGGNKNGGGGKKEMYDK